MHYQVVVLASEIDTSLIINSLSLHCRSGYDSSTVFRDLRIYAGLSDLDQLTTNFLENYSQESRTLVLGSECFEMPACEDGWLRIPFEQGFVYDGSHNLILEFEWSSGTSSVFDWQWDAGAARALYSTDYLRFPVGESFESLVPHLVLTDSVAPRQDPL